jgi:hypothetical protein
MAAIKISAKKEIRVCLNLNYQNQIGKINEYNKNPYQ